MVVNAVEITCIAHFSGVFLSNKLFQKVHVHGSEIYGNLLWMSHLEHPLATFHCLLLAFTPFEPPLQLTWQNLLYLNTHTHTNIKSNW